MEFRCEKCQHVGAAASTTLGPSGFVFACANCAHENVLSLGQTSPESPSPSPAAVVQPVVVPPPSIPKPAAAPAANADVSAEDTFRRFLPPQGEGPRCPKCANLVGPDEPFCARCGLNQDDAFRHKPGEAPWERAPVGKEEPWDAAALLWNAFVEAPDDAKFERFAGYVREHELQDFAARKLRFYLVEHTDDPRATKLLREIASTVQTRMMVAKAQAKASSAEFSDVTQRARNVLLWTSLVFWLMILVVLLTRYMC